MSINVPKLRQTCDACRKSKIRCDRRQPVCGRCLVTGAACDFGVSNQGGRWRNGQKLESQRRTSSSGQAKATLLKHHSPDDSPLTLHTASSPNGYAWQHTQDSQNSSWSSDTALTQFQYLSVPPTPSMTSGAPSCNYMSPGESLITGPYFNDADSITMAPANPTSCTNSQACICSANSMVLLQALHYLSNLDSTDLNTTASCATILDHNEDIVSRCSSTLSCQVCNGDERGDSIIITSTLLRKLLSLTQDWAMPSGTESPTNPTQLNTMDSGDMAPWSDEAELKRDVLLITVKNLEQLFPRLREAGQALMGHNRLACAALCASISEQLRRARDAATRSP